MLLYMSCKWSPRDLFRSPSFRYFERNMDEHKKKLSPCGHFVVIFCDKESCHRPSCESQCLRTPSTTANCPFLSRRDFPSQVTGTHWTTLVIPSDVTVPGPHRRFDGALATPARCDLREERQEHVADHIGRVAPVDHGEELLTLATVPWVSTLSRVPRSSWCWVSRRCTHIPGTRQRRIQQLFGRRCQIAVQTHELSSRQARP